MMTFILSMLIGLVSLSSCANAEEEPAKRNGADLPNIVLIVADDLGWADVGYHNDRFRTPHIDRLTHEGIELDRFYVSPLCSPTRAGLMTGRYPIRYGMARSVIPPWRNYGLEPNEITIPEVLGKVGYAHRAIFGKWHLGHLNAKWHPLAQGFTHFRGHYNGAVDYYTHKRMGERDWHVDGEASTESGYTTDLIAEAASGFIDKHAGNGPFFCYVAFNAPHQPLQAPDKYKKIYTNLSGDERTVAAMVTCMDDGIGKILGRLDAAGVRDNTIVWFLSDNGGIKEIANNNLPLRGNKREVFEGGIRVPACVRWPSVLPAGTRVDVPTAYVDLLPTLMDMIGVGDHAGERLDGVSLLPLLKGETAVLDRELFFYHGHLGPDNEEVAVITPVWKLVILGPKITGGVNERHRTLLFRINEDPFEKNDVAASHPDVVAELTARLVEYRTLQPRDAVPPFFFGQQGFRVPKQWQIPASRG